MSELELLQLIQDLEELQQAIKKLLARLIELQKVQPCGTSRDSVVVKRLELTPEDLKRAIARATENSKYWVVWKDPKDQKTTAS